MEELKLGSHVRFTILDSRAVVLDLRSGVYLTLAPDASARFRRLAGGEAPRDARDASLVEKADQLGLLRELLPTKPELAPAMRLPTTVTAWLVLLRARTAIHRDEFASHYARAARWTPRSGSGVRSDRVVAAFLRAESLVFQQRNPRDCVPRSLALYELLLRAGHPARHVIGVRAGPFMAHAWVEIGGEPALDHSTFTGTFNRLAVLG